jgi:Leucine-rich repeat (LRR) protein
MPAHGAPSRTKLQKDGAPPPPKRKRKSSKAQGARKKQPPKAPSAAPPPKKKAAPQAEKPKRNRKKKRKIAAPQAEAPPEAAAPAPPPPQAESYTGIMIMFAIAVIIIIGGGAVMVKQKLNQKTPTVAGTQAGDATPDTTGGTADTPEVTTPAEQSMDEKVAALRRFVEANPDAVEIVPQRYGDLITETEGTPLSDELTAELAAWEATLQKRVADLIGTLKTAAQALAREGNLVEGTAVLNDYSGALAEHTKTERTAAAMALAEEFNRLAGSPDPTRPKGLDDDPELKAIADRLNITADPGDGSAYLSEWVKSVADQLTAGNIWELPEYLAVLERQVTPSTLGKAKSGLDEMRRVGTIKRRIYSAFKVAQGQDITVKMRSGPEKVKVVGISEEGIELMAGGQFKTVSADKLAYAEKLERLGNAMNADIVTMRGLVSLEHRDLRRALKAFESTDTKLGRMLAGRTRTLVSEAVTASKTAQDVILAAYNIDRGAIDSGTMPEEAPVAKEKLVDLKKDVRDYHTQHGKADASADTFTNTIEKWIVLWQQETNVEPKEVDLVKTPADRFALLKEKLDLANASYQQKSDTLSSYKTDDDGKIVELTLHVGKIQDISAIPAITPNLTKLVLLGYPTEVRDRGGNLKRALFNDLRPLRGLQLEHFECQYTEVSSLRPLSKMPLKVVDVRGCEVDNIEHLQDLPLERVNLQHNPLFSLLPLQRKTTITELNMGGTMVIDLASVSTMTGLRRLHCPGSVFDSLSAIKDMPIEDLDLSDCRISDLEPLRGKSFRRLSIAGSRVEKFKILRDIKVQFLDVSRTPFNDLRVLKETGVTELIAADTKLERLYDLRDTDIQRLDISETMIKGLRGIEKSKVTDLVARASFLREIKSIAGSPVTRLNISETKVDNLSPLIGSKVETLEFDRYNIIRDKKFLLQAASLLTLNGEEFPPK